VASFRHAYPETEARVLGIIIVPDSVLWNQELLT